MIHRTITFKVRLTASLLVCLLLLCMMPQPAQASVSAPIPQAPSVSAEVPDVSVTVTEVSAATYAAGGHYYEDGVCPTCGQVQGVTQEEALPLLRQQMAARAETVTVRIEGEALSGDGAKALLQRVWEHTGNPKEGDYLYKHFGGAGLSTRRGTDAHGVFSEITYTPRWYTTAQQEAEVDAAIRQLLIQWDLDGADDYTKVRTVYAYLCDNITYDYDNLNDEAYLLKYSAYAALIDETAVCQGISSLFYRLCLELGVDCRVVTGVGNGGRHAWNIVQLNGLYYNADPTWDLGTGANYRYFLRSESNFGDHTRDAEFTTAAFSAAYPMASTSYVSAGNAVISLSSPTAVNPGDTVTVSVTLSGDNLLGVSGALHYDSSLVTLVDITPMVNAPWTVLFSGDRFLIYDTSVSAPIQGSKALFSATFRVNANAPTDARLQFSCTDVTASNGTQDFAASINASSAQVHRYQAVVTPPTCSAQGYTTHICACGRQYIDTYVPAKGHSMGAWSVTKPASCTDKGSEQRKCANCSHTETRDIAAKGHSYKHVVTPPTCTAEGYTTHTCSTCSHSYKDTPVPAKGHSMGAWSVTKPASCTAKGTEQRKCANCTRTETRDIAVKDHSYKRVVTPPTCTAEGYTTHTCSTCGHSYKDTYVNAKGHSMGAWSVTKPATCTDKGAEQRKCANCSHTETRDITAKGHSYKHVVTPPTCTAEGYTTHTCSTCSHSYKDTPVSATGHSMGAWSVTKPASCTDKGTEQRKCANCTHTETRDIAAKGHSYKHVVTPPTCTAQGYTTYTCSTCSHSYKDTPVSAKGHSMGTWSVTKPASCTDKGTEQRKCANCTHTETRDIAAKGHNYKHVVTPPTCTAEGYTTHTCSTCSHSYTDTYVSATGHSMGAWSVTKPASCTEKGSEQRKCANCSHTETREIAAKGHSYKHVVTPPTCTAQGYTTHTCSTCRHSYKDTFVPAKGHIYSGEHDRTCDTCGATREVDEEVLRVYGSNRFDTAFGAANLLKETLGVDKFDNVIVACGTNFADALAGSYLGKVKNAPILLVQPNMVPTVRAYIEANLKPGGTVYLLGGETIVPGGVSEGLNQFVTKRLWGANRYETNLAILEEAGVTGGEILVCTGYGFADSLSASAVGKPILLVDKRLDAKQQAFLAGLRNDRYIIVGGVGAVNEVVEDSLKGYGAIERLAGANRFTTSVMVAERFFDSPTTAVVAYAANFPDGLCGGPLAAAMGGPLLLTANNDAHITAAYTEANGIRDGVVLGGPGLISDAAVRKVFAMRDSDNIILP